MKFNTPSLQNLPTHYFNIIYFNTIKAIYNKLIAIIILSEGKKDFSSKILDKMKISSFTTFIQYSAESPRKYSRE